MDSAFCLGPRTEPEELLGDISDASRGLRGEVANVPSRKRIRSWLSGRAEGDAITNKTDCKQTDLRVCVCVCGRVLLGSRLLVWVDEGTEPMLCTGHVCCRVQSWVQAVARGSWHQDMAPEPGGSGRRVRQQQAQGPGSLRLSVLHGLHQTQSQGPAEPLQRESCSVAWCFACLLLLLPCRGLEDERLPKLQEQRFGAMDL